MRDSALGVARAREENISDTAVSHELFIHRHFEVRDGAVGGEDFAEVGGVDVFGEFFDDDFGAARRGRCWGGGACVGAGGAGAASCAAA